MSSPSLAMSAKAKAMIVGIQALRLEYYEMFSRYYTGGGKKYQALTAAEA